MGYTLVTGATSDIGKQICQTLVAEGHTILLSDLSEEALNDVCASLDGEGHLILPLDLSNVEESKEALSAFIKEKQIAVTHAVFAAGIFAIKPLKLMNYEFVKKNFDIAVFSMLFLSQVLASKKTNGTPPGSTAFTRTFGASSAASDLRIPNIEALTALYVI